jgi:hypothetical protein
MRVDDVRPESPGGLVRVACEAEVAPLAAAAPVEHRAFDDVAAGRQLFLEPADEHTEIGVGRPGIHLRDKKDSHA